LIVRNRAVAGGSAFVGNAARFVNTTIAENQGIAVVPKRRANPWATSARSDITFVHTILSGNAGGNCGPAASDVGYATAGRNVQHPGANCGAAVEQADPSLDSMFVPAWGSPALGTGDNAICLAQPVNGRDVYGQRRPRFANCSVGAVEGDVEQILNRRRRSLEIGQGLPLRFPSRSLLRPFRRFRTRSR
jgi:hypothetical protein